MARRRLQFTGASPSPTRPPPSSHLAARAQVGLFLARAGLADATRLVALPNPVAYDVDPAEPDLEAWRHAPNPRRGVNPHKMKTDRQYRDVVAAYEATYLAGGAPAVV